MTRIVLSLTLALGTSQLATGQQPAVDQAQLKNLQAEVKTLRLQVKELQARLRKQEVKQPRAGDGTGHLLVMPGIASSSDVSFAKGALITLRAKDAEAIADALPDLHRAMLVITLTAKDAEAIGRECPAVRSVAPVVRTRTQVTFANRNWVPSFIYGTTPAFLDVREWTGLKEGEPFTEADVRNQARVCLIGQTIKRKLFDKQSPLGREIRLANVTFKVVGVLSERGETVMGLDRDDIVVAPWTSIKARVSSSMLTNVNQSAAATANSTNAAVNAATSVSSLSQLYPRTNVVPYPMADPLRFGIIDQIVVRAKSTKEIPAATRQIADLLRQRHHIKKGQPDDFGIRDLTELVKILRPDKTQK
jgi:hypothetical protein